ncbi:cation-dependent mannose-6-phosphate receptor-like [Dreissena polymorpha]|uniref:cation-dependent mannose-6-phosphate receptor-like n=1 Tax=Dreissena polymorpha TaxID=45954 RepID=UPI002263B0CF|nr:cation-dependent mannose-6-phosphate receptor-like [Dreissena polymorpha]
MDFAQCLIIYLSILCVSKIVTSQTCQKSSACSCKEGEFTFDLSPLNTKNPRFSVNATSAGTSYMYTFQPCTPLAECGAATTAAACQTAQTAGSVSYNLGTSNSANFNGSIIANTLELQFTEGLEGRRTFIKMVCKKDGDPELKYEDESPSKNYKFILLSSYACQPSPTPSPGRGLSPGSVLVILFFVFLFVYFVAGMLFMKFGRGAVGTEVIPNYGFWSSLPGLIKEGVAFTCSGCKADTSYAKI